MKTILQEKRAQGGLEYVAILGGAIIVALIVGAALKSAANTIGQRGAEASTP